MPPTGLDCQKFGHGRHRFAAPEPAFASRRYRRGRRLRFGLRCRNRIIVFRSVFAQSRIRIVNAGNR